MTILRRLISAVPDMLALLGLLLLAYGMSQFPIVGPALGPITLGLEVVALVRVATPDKAVPDKREGN